MLSPNLFDSRLITDFRRSCPEVLRKKSALKNFGLMPTTLLKKRLWHRYFPLHFVKMFKNMFFCRIHSVAAWDFKQKCDLLDAFLASKAHCSAMGVKYPKDLGISLNFISNIKQIN